MSVVNIVVIGTGMYSTGRGTNSFGTILPAIGEWKRSGANVGKVKFVGSNGNNTPAVLEKFKQFEQETGITLGIEVFPADKRKNSTEYKTCITDIPKPACAIVVVPDHLHYEVIKDCLLNDLPVLVVKPLTPLVSEAKNLIRIANERKIYGAVEFHKRWDKANLLIKDAISKKRIGELLYIWVEYSQRKSIPTEIFRDWSSRSNILQYLGVHYIDIVLFYTGAKPLRVMAIGQKNWLFKQGIDTWDAIQCTIEWEIPKGARFVQTILTNWIDPETTSAMSDQKINIIGTEGRLESNQKSRGIKIISDDKCMEEPNPDFCMSYNNENGSKEWRGYGIESVVNFLNDVSSLNQRQTTLKSLNCTRPVFSVGLVSTAVIEAAAKSLNDASSWKEISLD